MTQKIVIFILFLIVALNVYVSQGFSGALYDVVVLKNSTTALSFLSQLEGTQEYVRQQQFLTGYLPSNFSRQLEINRTKTQNKIMVLHSYLVMNQKQPQILLLLSKAYRDIGNTIEAEKYLQQAVSIDPYIIP